MRTILVNLPVRKLELSRALFTELGLTVNPEFSDDKTACMVIDGNAFVMLIKQERFRGFHRRWDRRRHNDRGPDEPVG